MQSFVKRHPVLIASNDIPRPKTPLKWSSSAVPSDTKQVFHKLTPPMYNLESPSLANKQMLRNHLF